MVLWSKLTEDELKKRTNQLGGFLTVFGESFYWSRVYRSENLKREKEQKISNSSRQMFRKKQAIWQRYFPAYEQAWQVVPKQHHQTLYSKSKKHINIQYRFSAQIGVLSLESVLCILDHKCSQTKRSISQVLAKLWHYYLQATLISHNNKM